MKLILWILPLLCCLPAVCHATNGGTFTETWNQAAGEQIGCTNNLLGITACNQRWASTGTAANEAITSGGCGTGWNYTNQVKLPHGANAVALTTYGTLPYVGNTTTFDIFFEYCYTSTTVTGFRKFVDFRNLSGNSLFYIEQSSSGSGNVFYNGGTSHALSASTRHLIQYHNQTGACTVTVDGGSPTTITCVANDLNQITLTGDTGASAADIYFGNIYINVSGVACSPWSVPTSFFDGAGGTPGNTVTNASILAGLHYDNDGTNWHPPTYSAGTGAELIQFSNTSAPAYSAPATVCQTAYYNNTGLSLQHHIVNGSPSAEVTFEYDTVYPIKTAGFYITPNSSAPTTTAWTDQFTMVGSFFTHICTNTTPTGTGTCSGTGSNFVFCDETSGGTVNHCTPITNGNTYWLTGMCNSAGNDEVSLYNVNANGSAGSLVATNMPWLFPGTNCSGFGIAAVGSENPGVTFDVYFAGIEKCVADCSFPLLPPAVGVTMPAQTVKFPNTVVF